MFDHGAQAWGPAFAPDPRTSRGFRPPPLYMWRLMQQQWRTGEAGLRLLPGIVARERAAVDIGANKGVYTHYLSWLCPHVHAFEPNPRIYRILCRALPANAAAHPVALASRDGVSGELFVPMHGSTFANVGASLNPRRKARHGTIQVPCRTLDSFNLRDVGFIRIDVDGFEAEVLAGAARTIARERPVLLITVDSARTGAFAPAAGLLRGAGMHGHVLSDGGLYPLDAPDAERTSGGVTDFVFTPEESAVPPADTARRVDGRFRIPEN